MDQFKTIVAFDPFTLEDNERDCISLDGFSEALHRLLHAAWGDGFTYSEEEPSGGDPESIPAPHISFHILNREPTPEFKAFRSKVMDVIPDPDNPGYHINIKQRIFKCEVAWHCYHGTNRGSRLMAKKLEYFLENYVGYFKEHGLLQLAFRKENRPELDATTRITLRKTVLIYDAYVVETAMERTKTLHEIQVRAELAPKDSIQL